MSTTTTSTNDTEKRNEYAKAYQAARAEAVSALIKAHKDEWTRLFAAAKKSHGIQDASQRRLESKKAKASAMLAELKAQGIDVSGLV